MRIETALLNLETDQYAGKGQDAASLTAIAAAARTIEALGYDGAMTPEAGHDPFLPLAVAAEHTSRLTLGTNVAIAFPRSPLVTAQMAWDLQRFSGGRFQLGLGTQVKGHNERRYVAPWTGPPGPRLRDYILCLRAMFETFQSGSRPTYFEGEHYRFTMMPPFFNPGPIEHPHIPIYIAAVNRYTTRVAGELCDGLRLHPIGTFRYTKEVLLPTIAKGAAKAGRKPPDIDVVGAPFLAIAEDEAGIEAAKKELKQRIAFYASTRTYHAVLEFHGWEDVGQNLHRLSLEGKWQQMPELITDDMLHEWAVVASYDDLTATLKQHCSDIFSTVLLDLPPDFRRDEARVKEMIRRLRDA